jgi:hypothetical protein
MPVCINCRLAKPGVKLCADDLLCPECFQDNESKLAELKKQNSKSLSVAQESLTSPSELSSRTRASKTKQSKTKNQPLVSMTTTNTFSDANAAPSKQHQPSAVSTQPSDSTTMQPVLPASVSSAALTSVAAEDISALRLTVQEQQRIIDSLQRQLNYVLSFLGITDSNCLATELCTNDCSTSLGALTEHSADHSHTTQSKCALDNHATNQSLWSTVTANTKTKKSPNNFQQSLIAAVYNDQTESRRRESSLIITGFSEDQQSSDTEQFQDLCRDEFNMQPAIVSTRRLGRVQPNRSRPLLVVTRTVDQAQQLITAAKQLRQSTKQSVRDNVYISRNLTKAEAEAAYQSRVRRRQAAARTNKIPALPQDGAGGNVAVLQSTHATDIDASLSLLTIANNPHVIISPPSISQLPQQSAGVTLRSATKVEEQPTGRQPTRS